MFSFFYECEEKYQNMMDYAPHLIASINNDGQILDCNSRIFEILGYLKEEVIGLSILDFIHPNYHERAISTWQQSIPDQILKNEQLIMIHKDGSEVNVTIKLTGLNDDKFDRNTSVWIIDQAKNSIEKREQIKEKCKCANAEVYLDILNHDINNLTQAITAYSELLLMKPDLPVQFKKYFESTLHHSRTITDLISNVKNLSFLKNHNFEVKTVDVFRVLAEALDIVQQKNPNKLLLINQSISESEIMISSNDMLVFVFVNIINNAVNFEDSPEISIDIDHSITPEGQFWKLEFKDYGPGVPNGIKDKIFSDFEVGSEFNQSSGVGLGLALVKEIVERSGGSVWVEDRIPGDHSLGSNFVLVLPIAESHD